MFMKDRVKEAEGLFIYEENNIIPGFLKYCVSECVEFRRVHHSNKFQLFLNLNFKNNLNFGDMSVH